MTSWAWLYLGLAFFFLHSRPSYAFMMGPPTPTAMMMKGRSSAPTMVILNPTISFITTKSRPTGLRSSLPSSTVQWSTKGEKEPLDLSKFPVLEDTVTVNPTNIQAAGAVLGTLVGLSIGGPLTALILASLATYSTTTEGDWGEATRGCSEASLQAYNFAVKMNKKYSLWKKASGSACDTYRRFKADLSDRDFLDTAEDKVNSALDFTNDFSRSNDLGNKVNGFLVKTGELTVAFVKAVIKYNEENKVTEKIINYVKKEISKSS